MLNLVKGTYNAWCTGANGKQYRVVAIAGKWRLCVYSGLNRDEWLFVDDVEYPTQDAALAVVDTQP